MTEDKSIPKFTPGPWEARTHGSMIDIGAERMRITTIRSNSEDDWANARLVAAAPDLYAACRWIDEIQRRGHAFRGEWREAKAALQAALAKAEKGGGA